MDFIAIDVETANSDISSICQIGLASFKDGHLVEEWVSYIDPESFFEAFNITVHGINEETIADAPRMPEIAHEIFCRLEGRVVVCHTYFDRTALHQAFGRYELKTPECVWLDSTRVTRRTWKQFSSRGYGLKNVCEFLGYEFSHHDALEDAKAAGHIVLAAIEETGFSIQDWLVQAGRPIGRSSSSKNSFNRQGNPDGPLYGEVMVFTGTLTIPRRKAADLADGIGCEVSDKVTDRTTLLVVGDQDFKKLSSGHTKSSKHRKAEKLISQGQVIRILGESDFIEMVALARESQNRNSSAILESC